MAGQPHDHTGRQCTLCGKEFTRRDIGHNITSKIKHFVVHILVCSECKIEYTKGGMRDKLTTWTEKAFG